MSAGQANHTDNGGYDCVVEMSGIHKTFGDVHAVNSGRFTLRKGEIHSLIGENGAGKSTLMKILYGIHSPDSGEIAVNGVPRAGYSTRDAINMGFGMVHQEFMLVNELSVLKNIILGFEPTKRGIIDFDAARREIGRYIDEYGFEIHLDKRISDISVGEAQKVEILKTLYRGAKIIILDEPTAVLTPQEAGKLFEILQLLKEKGISIVFISHKLNEVMEISDRITVMRDGRHIDTADKGSVTIPQLAEKMVGRDVVLRTERTRAPRGECVLSLRDVYASSDSELSKLKGMSFDLHAGEVLGVAGVDGNGQSELAEVITGLRRAESGSILVNGKEIQNRDVRSIRRAGIAFIPDDRNTRGLSKSFPIMENLIANMVDDVPYSSGGVIRKNAVRDFACRMHEDYDIRPRNPELKVENLSGGNAQKVVFAREIESDFNVLIAAQPTRGVDVGSIENIHKLINRVKSAHCLIKNNVETAFVAS
jgi:simple sugar transport system ATP-binding protein